jgi:phage terminase large subunit-like protein
MSLINEYVEVNYAKLERYIDDISHDKVICGRYEKLAVERFIRLKNKYLYDEKAVKRVIKFFYFININDDNIIKKIDLMPFQIFWIANVYGLKTDETTRLINTAFITIAKKNGKTLFNSVLCLYEIIADGELSASVVLLATTRDQARIALDYLKEIIDNSPELPPLKVFKNTISYRYKNTVCQLFIKSADSDKIQGQNLSASLIDEYAYHRTSTLADRAKSASSSRKNPLQILITTASHSKDYAGYQMQEICKNILSGEVDNDTIFTQIFCQDNIDEEFHQPHMWVKSNPALGKTVKKNNLYDAYQQALIIPSKKVNFTTDNLNHYVDSLQVWISDDHIKRLMKKAVIPIGSEVYVGVDLSSTRDLASICTLYYDEKADFFHTFFYVFFPKSSQDKLIKKGGIDLSRWIEKGYIIQTQLPTLDEDEILNYILKINEQFKINCVGIDPWNAAYLSSKLQGEYNVEVNKVRQTVDKLSYPLKYMEKIILNNQINLDDNPTTRWQFRNIVMYADTNQNIKIMKNKNNDSVDIPVSLNIAFHQYLAYNNSDISTNLNDYLNLYDKNQA